MIRADTLPVKCNVMTCNCVVTDFVWNWDGCRIVVVDDAVDDDEALSKRIMVHSKALFVSSPVVFVVVIIVVVSSTRRRLVLVLVVVVPNCTNTVPCIVPGEMVYIPVQEADIFCRINCNGGVDDIDDAL